MTGRVFLIGAGPGDPGLITVRGLEVLHRADVVLHDRLVAPALLQQARPGAMVIDVGKVPGRAPETQIRIHRLLVQHATAGRTVARLKGGDPFVFGRGAEEALACQAAGIPCEVIPGVTSAVAVPGAAGIPLTRRGVARSFAVVAPSPGTGDLDGAASLAGVDTLVVLMSRAAIRIVTRQLIDYGRDGDTPAACIQDGTLPSQRVVRATLATIADRVEAAGLEAPLVTVIGPVAGP